MADRDAAVSKTVSNCSMGVRISPHMLWFLGRQVMRLPLKEKDAGALPAGTTMALEPDTDTALGRIANPLAKQFDSAQCFLPL